LYLGKEAYEIGFLSILSHFWFNVIFLLLVPFMGPIMFVWMLISSFQLTILYIYATVIKQDDGGLEEEEDEIDIYY
jgi:hypothetical protein